MSCINGNRGGNPAYKFTITRPYVGKVYTMLINLATAHLDNLWQLEKPFTFNRLPSYR